jgi:hypothetical protein
MPTTPMIRLARSIPTRFSSMTRSDIPTTIAKVVELSASSMNIKIAVTPHGVTMIGMASGVTAGVWPAWPMAMPDG